jgi:aminomuconate-semialdehyde/2-hydroxymuconate-6-semialdehyde dehydrogenase
MHYLRNYINGELIAPNKQQYLDCYEPANGQVYAQVPHSDVKDIELAVEAAKKAFPAWAKTSLDERHALLMRLSRLIDENLEKLARAESTDNGKPVWLATAVDIPRASSNFRFFATALMQFASESHEMSGLAINYTLRQPLGVVACISPWNLPLYLFTWKIAPALATGNCVVAKPSEVTPMTAYLLSELAIEAGFPPGVLNIVHGDGPQTGSALTTHPDIKAISFTGGTQTGATIARLAAPQFKKLSLELGGKNPNIVFADCNYEDMLATSVRSSFANQGEICLCGSRIFVERSIYKRFRRDFVERVKALEVGDPHAGDSKLGAIVSEAHMHKILSYIELAQSEGGQILCGGNRVYPAGRCETGWFIEPTVLDGLDHLCRTNQEEIFGPVVSLMPFDTEEEVLSYANSTPYGLAATLWTQNLDRAHRMAAQIQSGIVWINCWLLRDLRTPFGGMKQSGVGREGGWEAMRFFTEPKNICIKYGHA